MDTDGDIHPVQFARLVIAAGCHSGKIAAMCGLGCEAAYPQMYNPLPVVPLKRHVFTAYSNNADRVCCLDNPIVRDPTGAFFVKAAASNHIICSEPMPSASQVSWDRAVDYDAWTRTRQIVTNRLVGISDQSELVLRSARAALVDYNVYDANWIIGQHPYLDRVYFACGSSGNGIQHALAIGKAMYELQGARCYKSLNLERLGFQRIVSDTPLKESIVV